jgi:hypothetical protein
MIIIIENKNHFMDKDDNLNYCVLPARDILVSWSTNNIIMTLTMVITLPGTNQDLQNELTCRTRDEISRLVYIRCNTIVCVPGPRGLQVRPV